MLKRILIIGFLGIAGLNGFTQENAQTDTVPPLELQRQVFIYGMATKYGDQQMAKTALYNILSITPQNIGILDSLALMYYQDQNYASAALVSQDVVNINPDDQLATEIAAVSFENLGVKERAVGFYEKLYLLNNNLGILYQAAYLQYDLKRFAEAVNNVNLLLEHPNAGTENLTIMANQFSTQQIPMIAGVLRLKGMIEIEQGDTDAARQSFTKALELAPSFKLVEQQLKELN